MNFPRWLKIEDPKDYDMRLVFNGQKWCPAIYGRESAERSEGPIGWVELDEYGTRGDYLSPQPTHYLEEMPPRK